ncbi:hypothetical protein U0070_005889 [Myodes glareolus]|uniref:Uncharacterized protein n=1 Tax=Myodes glareolus TaxID=447135 RepID=A0AAW0GZM7_MYOGA
MAVPMMLLSLVEQLGEEDEELTSKYAELGDWCAHRILQHVQLEAKVEAVNLLGIGKWDSVRFLKVRGPMSPPPLTQQIPAML